MRAILVCVDYSDLLAITLPYNRQHFEEVWVVTSPQDEKTQDLILQKRRQDQGVHLFVTEAFTLKGAPFNKWLALEEGLDWMGRDGWICLMDADVLWPKTAPTNPRYRWDTGKEAKDSVEAIIDCNATNWERWALTFGHLYSPLRRMWENWPEHPPLYAGVEGSYHKTGIPGEERLHWIPNEDQWHRFSIHRNTAEWAGYSQIFHTKDPVLGDPPWHEVNWEHAGGADSFFQNKWPQEKKVRPPFEVLHLGPAGQNWYGRATALASGELPENREEKLQRVATIWEGRRKRRLRGEDPFQGERLN